MAMATTTMTVMTMMTVTMTMTMTVTMTTTTTATMTATTTTTTTATTTMTTTMTAMTMTMTTTMTAMMMMMTTTMTGQCRSRRGSSELGPSLFRFYLFSLFLLLTGCQSPPTTTLARQLSHTVLTVTTRVCHGFGVTRGIWVTGVTVTGAVSNFCNRDHTAHRICGVTSVRQV